MKNHIAKLAIVCILCLLAMVGCREIPEAPEDHGTEPVETGSSEPSSELNSETGSEKPDDTPPTKVFVVAKQPAITIMEGESADYPYDSLFTVIENGVIITVDPSCIDLSALGTPVQAGTYPVTCTYQSVQATVMVTVLADMPDISVQAKQSILTLRDTELAGYDFASLFVITEDEETVPVLQDYLDLSGLDPEADTCRISCTYRNFSATVHVQVLRTVYEILLETDEVTVNQIFFDTYDYLSLFCFTVDGVTTPITPDMITSDVAYEVGDYSYTVAYGNVSRTLTVHITNAHEIEIYPAASAVSIPVNELLTYRYISLFAIYVDGVAVRTTEEMLDLSAITGDLQPGDQATVSVTCSVDSTVEYAQLTVLVSEEEQPVVTVYNAQTYPNGEIIDLTTLFRITKGDTEIPVTADMVSGTVDYSRDGINLITLSYGGETYTASVTVRLGVLIQYGPRVVLSEEDGESVATVYVRRGTNRDTYAFVDDFILIINGIHYQSIPASCFDLSGVDFSTPGEYPVTLTVYYNELKENIKASLSGTKVNFTQVRATVRYVVVENEVQLSVKSDEVVLPHGTTDYNPFGNLSVTVNGISQKLTENPLLVSSYTCYAELLSDTIDFSSVLAQEIRVAVYANGVEAEPMVVSFTVRIEGNVRLTATDRTVLSGTTLYPTDCFTLTDSSGALAVTPDMITGRLDLFTPGIYTLTAEYMGLCATAQVCVLDSSMIGTYRTYMTTTATDSELDEDGDVVSSATPASTLANLVISADGSVTWGTNTAASAIALDSYTMLVTFNRFDYMLYYEDGIVVLDPINPLHMSFSDTRRPVVFFHENAWKIEESVTLNYSSKGHILANQNMNSYSIDIARVTSLEGERELWYGMYLGLVYLSSADHIYETSWGEILFAEPFAQLEMDAQSSLTLNGRTYPFTKTSDRIATVGSQTTYSTLYDGTYTGTVDGADAKLVISSGEQNFLYSVNGMQIVYVSSGTLSNMKNGGVDHATGTVLLYAFNERNSESYSDGEYSYRFLLDPEAKTFTLMERDLYYGRYVLDNHTVFLDGYGTGVINFDTSSYVKYPFTYQVSSDGAILTVTYVNTLSNFAYGERAVFYLSKLLNVLTVKEMPGTDLVGKQFVNAMITDGAIVEISSYQITASSSVLNSGFYQNIRIVTKDGELTLAEKQACIDVSAVAASVAGFYRFSVTVDINGSPVVSYYTLEVLGKIYRAENYPVVSTSYKAGLLSGRLFSLNEYGQVTVVSGGGTYTGLASVSTDQTFFARAYSTSGTAISVSGTPIASGLIQVTVSGAENFVELFTTGSVAVAGNGSLYLRAITSNGETTVIRSYSLASLGETVTAEAVNGKNVTDNGVILRLTAADGSISYLMVTEWNQKESGLVLSDAYRGSYACEGAEELTVNGFGEVTLGELSGTYTSNGDTLTVTFGSAEDVRVYRLNAASMTYAQVEVALDETLVSGRTYEKSYTCTSADGTSYTVTTSFAFDRNGSVTVTTVSGDNAVYAPRFASASGTNGTYEVLGNTVTVRVNGYVFTFRIRNVLNPVLLTCTGTTFIAGEDGLFKVNLIFEA